MSSSATVRDNTRTVIRGCNFCMQGRPGTEATVLRKHMHEDLQTRTVRTVLVEALLEPLHQVE